MVARTLVEFKSYLVISYFLIFMNYDFCIKMKYGKHFK